MGNLTDDMTRLRGEVEALRGVRGALMNDLTRGARDLAATVSAMRADFTSAHAAMAKKTGEEREAFVAAVISEVNSLLGAFSRDRDDMARKGRHDRGVFLSEMRRQVTRLCKETADDMMGARLAWRGESPGKSRPVPMKKKPVVVKRTPPPMEAALKKTVAAPEFRAKKPLVTIKEPLKTEEKKTFVAVHQTPAGKPRELKTLAPVVASIPFTKKEKSRPGKKPAEAFRVALLALREESLPPMRYAAIRVMGR